MFYESLYIEKVIKKIKLIKVEKVMNSNKTIITVGPIIGKVTENYARVLIELNKNTTLTLELYEINYQKNKNGISNKIIFNKPIFLVSNDCDAFIPQIFEFKNLQENTRYKIIINNDVNYSNENLAELECSFKTTKSIDNANDIFRIAFLSCNSSKYRKEFQDKLNLWKILAQKVEKEEIDYCIHMGDQVYLDDANWKGTSNNVFAKCQKIWKDAYEKIFSSTKILCSNIKGKMNKNHTNSNTDIEFNLISFPLEEQWEIEKKKLSSIFCDLISEEYRYTFNEYYQAKVLRNVPNLMILDDHEIFDDFGFDVKSYNDSQSFDYFFSEQARLCYYKYQKILWENIDLQKSSSFQNPTSEHHFHLINGIGLFFEDFRGCRTWLKKGSFKNDSNSCQTFLLGNKQLDDIKLCFDKKGLFDKAKCAIYIAPTPLAFFSKESGKIAACFVNDVKECWSLVAPNDQVYLLDILKNYRERTQNDICIIGGDSHLGYFTSIYLNGNFVIEQMITSPICQSPPDDIETKVFNFFLNLGSKLKNGYSFKHFNPINDLNFGICEFRPVIFNRDDNAILNANSSIKRLEIFAKHVRGLKNGSLKEDKFRKMGFRDENLEYTKCNCSTCCIF